MTTALGTWSILRVFIKCYTKNQTYPHLSIISTVTIWILNIWNPNFWLSTRFSVQFSNGLIPFEYWTFLSGFRTSIWKPDHLTTGHVWTIQIIDFPGIQMVTVVLSFNIWSIYVDFSGSCCPLFHVHVCQLPSHVQMHTKCHMQYTKYDAN